MPTSGISDISVFTSHQIFRDRRIKCQVVTRLNGKLDAIEEITRASFSWGYVVDKKGDFSCEVVAGGFVRESQGQSQITRRSTTVSLEILFIDLQ